MPERTDHLVCVGAVSNLLQDSDSFAQAHRQLLAHKFWPCSLLLCMHAAQVWKFQHCHVGHSTAFSGVSPAFLENNPVELTSIITYDDQCL